MMLFVATRLLKKMKNVTAASMMTAQIVVVTVLMKEKDVHSRITQLAGTVTTLSNV